ncbi:MAG TPA: M28 family peptidase [Thermoanaerobaculia bacterium]
MPAYSEFMPAPRLGVRPCGDVDPRLFAAGDPWGWRVTEYEEALELRPGMAQVAAQVLHALGRLGAGEPAPGIGQRQLEGNPCWPEELRRRGAPPHERCVLLLPLALARTQDDMGRIRWTLFGASEQGPERAFWRGFWTAPERELDEALGLAFFARLLAAACGETTTDLRRAGWRLLAGDGSGAGEPGPRLRRTASLPSWTEPFLWQPGRSLRGVRYLLTFRPFARLPAAVRGAYLAGDLHLLPFPGSLLYWGAPAYAELARELPFARQIPLLHSIERHEGPHGLRVPQSGWMHEPRSSGEGAPEASLHGEVRNTYQRTHRWARVHRHEDQLVVGAREDRVARVLFSAAADDVGLYDKPMARNAQIWTRDFHLLLDGPRAGREEIVRAGERLAEGGSFGYRFLYPAMRVGRHEVYWHRPLVAHRTAAGEPALVADPPLGYLTAYDAERPDLSRPLELWPRLLARPPHVTAVEQLRQVEGAGPGYRRDLVNVRKLLDAAELAGGRPLDPGFARALLTLPREESLADWLAGLAGRAEEPAAVAPLVAALRAALAPAADPGEAEPLTFERTAVRSFETAYWRTISGLATGRFVNKDNADCVLDRATQRRLAHRGRDLERLGDFLLGYHERTIARAGMERRAFAGSLPFRWRTDFDFSWSGGWSRNQTGAAEERDLIVVIPGRDRSRAVVMADHYDTAYMEDVFGYPKRKQGPRLAAAGADDNHSATAALMLGAPIFLDLARVGRLACDVWLVHLTGEEFPSDCLGARHLAGCLMRRELAVETRRGRRRRDLSGARVQGLYVLDMVAHNNDKRRDVFQICPGSGPESLWLAYQAHVANRLWNDRAPEWNRRHRRGRRRGVRSADGRTVPGIALHPRLLGEVRPAIDPRSTLYNTDGQIFSDAGVPAVLLMENYDIDRHGYHDSHDTMENIDLDYGSAVAAIAIEAVARAATEEPRWCAF